jgi:adenylylsulfate kinase
MKENIHPIFETLLTRTEREKLLQQRAKAIWLTGLSGSGKSTVAKALENELYLRNYKSFVLDGDNVRTGISNNLSFSLEDRNENIRRVAEVAKLFVEAGMVAICSFITPLEKQREMARNIIGEKDFFLVYLNTPINVCEQRDVKGLYAKAKKNEIPDFTGVSSPFEEPQRADLVIYTENKTVYEVFTELLEAVLPLLELETIEKPQYEQYNI